MRMVLKLGVYYLKSTFLIQELEACSYFPT